MNWLKEWARQAKEIVLSPADFYDDLEARENYKYPIKFAVTSAVVSALLVFVVQELQVIMVTDYSIPAQLTGLSGLGFLLVAGVIEGTLGLFVNSGFIHIFAYLFGFKDYQKTTEAISYPTAINAVLSWIPLVNIFALLYQLYGQVKGIEKVHGMTKKKAAVSVILGTLLLILVFMGIAVLFLTLGYTSLQPPAEQSFGSAVEAMF